MMKKIVKQFEEKIQKALEFKYKKIYPQSWQDLLENNILIKWNLLNFYELYIKSNVYSKTRMRNLMFYLFDIKLQLYYILEVDSGLYNLLIYNRGYNNKNINDFSHVKLTKFSLDQNFILKSRILWERLMNFIYFLETGEELENKISKTRSKKKVFFDLISNTKWKFLKECKGDIDWFDERLRAQETHKFSFLRKHFLKDSDVDPTKISMIINIVTNVIWDNVLSIIQGKEPSYRYCFDK